MITAPFTRVRPALVVWCGLVASLLAPTSSSAQARVAGAPQPGAPQRAVSAEEQSVAPASPEYRIGAADLLSISVSGLPTVNNVRVSNSGKIHVPFLGIVRANDLTVRQLEERIAQELRDKGLVKEPWVQVTIQQYRAQPVYILGEVMMPGQFMIQDEMYLTDLITLSGGFNIFATPVGYLYRRPPSTPGQSPDEVTPDEAIPIDFKALNEGTQPELNMKLQGGDVLYVPQRRQRQFYVVGDVRRPGLYKIEDEGPLLLASTALSQAGGPEPTAKLSHGILVRFEQDGRRQEIPMDFEAILRGRKPDVQVLPNDILFVPGSKVKTLGYGLLGMIPLTIGERASQVKISSVGSQATVR